MLYLNLKLETYIESLIPLFDLHFSYSSSCSLEIIVKIYQQQYFHFIIS
jgi:hypothetical protein